MLFNERTVEVGDRYRVENGTITVICDTSGSNGAEAIGYNVHAGFLISYISDGKASEYDLEGKTNLLPEYHLKERIVDQFSTVECLSMQNNPRKIHTIESRSYTQLDTDINRILQDDPEWYIVSYPKSSGNYYICVLGHN